MLNSKIISKENTGIIGVSVKSHFLTEKKIIVISALYLVASLLNANAQFTKLLDFAGTPNGKSPLNSLVSDGTFLYGMTYDGGISSFGTIFKVMPDGSGYVKLMDFAGTSNGSYPVGALMYQGGVLYGMTAYGGANEIGTIFKIMPDGTGYTKLLDFAGAVNGSYPYGQLISHGGFLYGMTSAGGTDDLGTLFKILPDGTGYSKLLDFTGIANGSYPQGNFNFLGGVLFGMTASGGLDDLGTIFKILPDGTGYSKLLDFADGSSPLGYLISEGSFLYGMTQYGGANNQGIIFKIMPDGTGYFKLLDFAGVSNGSNPYGSLISVGGILYGTTTYGGTNNMGTIFKILSNGTGYTKLFDFSSADGNNPIGTLISDGTFLFGMAYQGGTNNMGTIFKIRSASCNVSVSAGNDENSYFGYGPDQCVTKNATASGGTLPYTYTWTLNRPLTCNSGNESFTGGACLNNVCGSSISPSCTGATIAVCLTDTAELCVTATDANGCSSTDCALIFAEDVRCFAGNSNNQKVYLCHNGKSICVDQNAVSAHLSHGDFVGKCTSQREGFEGENDITVFPNPSNGDFDINCSNITGESVNIDMRNIIGQLVFTAEFVNTQYQFNQHCDLTHLQNGTYFIRIWNNNFSEMHKIILSK